MNNCTFIGNVGKDAELKTFDSGKQVINFSIAVSEGKGEHKKTTWIECAKFGEKTGILPYLKKGTQVAVTGNISLRTWDGGAAIALRVAEVQLIGGKPANEQSTGNNQSEQPAATPGAHTLPMNEPIDDLPF